MNKDTQVNAYNKEKCLLIMRDFLKFLQLFKLNLIRVDNEAYAASKEISFTM